MKVALTIWEDRISPVFDVAQTLLIVEFHDGKIVRRFFEPMVPEMSSCLACWLKDLGVEVLICGAISQMPANIIEAAGVQLQSFVGGKVEEVLGSFITGLQITTIYALPGCGRHYRLQGSRAGFLHQQRKEVRRMPGRDKTGPQGGGSSTGRGRGGCGTGQGDTTQGQGRGSGKGQGQGQGQGGGQGAGQGRRNRNKG
ncbi:MAG: NifB/NifX family molybdenum-iron cluster-binding protein [Desulfobulbaceae bacterium]|jgi:predicted Fe-Mo cluster-binding NifX family protein|nr:NifB/NifX family molybdenum-iron cluster-binding protein [Desulfobulbaceae bacterium]